MCATRLAGGQGGRSGERTRSACRWDIKFVEIVIRWVVRMKNRHSLLISIALSMVCLRSLTLMGDLAICLYLYWYFWRLTKPRFELQSSLISLSPLKELMTYVSTIHNHPLPTIIVFHSPLPISAPRYVNHARTGLIQSMIHPK